MTGNKEESVRSIITTIITMTTTIFRILKRQSWWQAIRRNIEPRIRPLLAAHAAATVLAITKYIVEADILHY